MMCLKKRVEIHFSNTLIAFLLLALLYFVLELAT
jgi:hypothetical protein